MLNYMTKPKEMHVDGFWAFWKANPSLLLLTFLGVVGIVFLFRPKRLAALFWILFLFVLATPVVWAVFTHSDKVAVESHTVPTAK